MDNGETLVLTHPETMEEQECRVVFLGEPADRQRVGVEFLTPAPRFWGWTCRMPRQRTNRTEQQIHCETLMGVGRGRAAPALAMRRRRKSHSPTRQASSNPTIAP